MIKFIKNLPRTKKLLIAILLLSSFLHFFRFDYPNAYVFDEVYHGFTAKEYAKGEIKAWEWWNTPPAGVAYEWTHPPLAKEIMAASLKIFQTEDPWGWRLPGVILGVLSVYLVYLIAKKLFPNQANESIALLSAFVFSLDGLLLVQSRTGMNDIYLVTFMLTSLLLLLNKKYFLSSIFFGMALASKWSAIYLIGLIFLTCAYKTKFRHFLWFIFIPPLIYLISYIPFFAQGHNLETFKGLQQQMWWYHTNLKATHDYASPWWSWPFNFFPVWYYVDYKESKIANIFASGNPMMFWFGFMAIIMGIYDFFKEKADRYKILFLLIGYGSFILPWVISPRIMFLYHYAPCIPFMSIALGYQLNKFTQAKDDRLFLKFILAVIVLSFLFVYPFLTGVALEKSQVQLFFKTNITKNPFGN